MCVVSCSPRPASYDDVPRARATVGDGGANRNRRGFFRDIGMRIVLLSFGENRWKVRECRGRAGMDNGSDCRLSRRLLSDCQSGANAFEILN